MWQTAGVGSVQTCSKTSLPYSSQLAFLASLPVGVPKWSAPCCEAWAGFPFKRVDATGTGFLLSSFLQLDMKAIL